MDPAEKRTPVYCLSSRRSIHSTTADWLKSVFSVTLKDDFKHEKNRESLYVICDWEVYKTEKSGEVSKFLVFEGYSNLDKILSSKSTSDSYLIFL